MRFGAFQKKEIQKNLFFCLTRWFKVVRVGANNIIMTIMKNVRKIAALYERLCADTKNFDRLQKCVKTESEAKVLRELEDSHRCYLEALFAFMEENFPLTASDVSDWSEKNFEAWLEFLIKYPVFWQDKKKELIGFFWSMDIRGTLRPKKLVAQLCTHNEMIDFAVTFHDEPLAKCLWVLIDKCATLSQAEQFQNRVDLAMNEIY